MARRNRLNRNRFQMNPGGNGQDIRQREREEDTEDILEEVQEVEEPDIQEDTPCSCDDCRGEGAALTEFFEGFQQSRKGNYFRYYHDHLLTVFKRDSGRWAWCISDEGEEPPIFSRKSYATWQEALVALRIHISG